MQQDSSAERQSKNMETAHSNNLVVTQPDKFQGLLGLLDTISLMDKVSERIGESKAGDLGGGGGQSSGQGNQGQSSRAQAIANLPVPEAMQKELSSYIRKEIKTLRKQVRRKAFRASKPGAAHQLNQLYSKIRRLNNLLSELMEASVEVLKRLFIRVFVDKQSI